MNSIQREKWIDMVLKDVLWAVTQSPELRDAVIFKGAWILNKHLNDNRHSMDIDAAAGPDWVVHHPSLDEQEAFLKQHFPVAVRTHFESQTPVRFSLDDARVIRNPPGSHPRGWDMFRILLTISDRQHKGVRGLPPVEVEISAPELFGPDAIETMDFQGTPAKAYSLHRIAGEKLRAYLTSLPAYRAKMGGGEREFRVKDLYDLARILRARPINDVEFWRKAAAEFKLACESRYVDCENAATFKQEWQQAKLRYEQDAHLKTISFDESETALDTVSAFFTSVDVFPLAFDPPPIQR